MEAETKITHYEGHRGRDWDALTERADNLERLLSSALEAMEEHRRIARGGLIEMLDEAEIKRLDAERFPDWTMVAERRNDDRLHKTASDIRSKLEKDTSDG